MLTIQLIDEQAELNNYYVVETKQYIPNFPFTINLEIFDGENSNRFMPTVAAKMNLLFQKRDGTTLSKAASPLFNPQDMSMWTVQMSAADSNDIVGSNFQIFLDVTGDSTAPDLSDATELMSGMAYNVISKIQFDGEC